MSNLTKIIIAVVVLILIVAIPVTLRLSQQQQQLKSKAATSSQLLSFDPQTVSVSAPNQNFTTNLVVTNTTGSDINITGYKIIVNFDKTVLSVKSISYKAGQRSVSLNGDGDGSASNLADINNRGQILLWGEVTDASGKSLTAGISNSFVEIGFTANQVSATSISNSANTSYLKVIKPDSTLENLTLPGASLTINQGSAPTSEFVTDSVKVVEDNNRTSIPVDDPIWDSTIGVIEKPYSEVKGKKLPFVFRDLVCVTSPCDTVPNGDRWVHVLFIGKDSQGNTVKKSESTKIYLALEPKIDGISCEVSASGGTSLTIKGNHLGANVGSVRMGNVNAPTTATTWGNLTVTTTIPGTMNAAGENITLTTPEGQSATNKCTLGKSQIEFTASLACRSVSKALTSASVEIKEAVGIGSTAPAGQGGVSVFKQDKVGFDSSGRAQGLTSDNILENKNYNLYIQAPLSLRKVVPFKAQKGTTVLQALDLPLGDIEPERADCKINSLDIRRLFAEWASNVDATNRKGDLNQDGRVNSIDYACMRSNFDKVCDNP